MAEESDTQDLYKGENVGHTVIMDEGRYRVFGGSVNRWAGRCAVFDPIDFERRDWVHMSGWPIDSATLSPYYDRAKAVAKFDEPWIPDGKVPAALGLEISGFSTPGLRPFVWRYAPSGFRNYPSWAKMYGEQLKADPKYAYFSARKFNWLRRDEGWLNHSIDHRRIIKSCFDFDPGKSVRAMLRGN